MKPIWMAAPLAAVLLLAFPGAASAQSGDVDAWRLVRKYCANCHETRPRPTSPASGADGAPSFAALAADPVKGSPRHLASILSGPHSSMPPHHFSDAEVEGIVHYFQALKSVKPRARRDG